MSTPTLAEILLEEAEEAIALDDLSTAKDCYRRILAMDPDHAIANLALQEFAREASRELTRDVEVRLACEPTEELLPTEVFILSQLAQGPAKISSLVENGRVGEPAVLLVLKRFMNRGVIAVH